jgi:polysaccharide deacetylase 2 family uncharacterized protein YibQ
MKAAYLTGLLASFFLGSCAQTNSQVKLKEKSKLQNRTYYVFGIHSVQGTVVNSIYKNYGVRVKSASCILDPDKTAENKRIDSIMYVQYNESISTMLKDAK